jgi:hypothetical protein
MERVKVSSTHSQPRHAVFPEWSASLPAIFIRRKIYAYISDYISGVPQIEQVIELVKLVYRTNGVLNTMFQFLLLAIFFF